MDDYAPQAEQEISAEDMRSWADDARKRDRENGIPNPLVETWENENRAKPGEVRCTFSHGNAACILRRAHSGGHYLTT